MKSTRKMKFTKTSLEKLASPARTNTGKPAYDVWYDTERPGFALRISSEGRISFLLFVRREGRSERISLGVFPRITVEQARSKARELDAEIVATGRDPNRERREQKSAIDLGMLFERYRKDYLVARNKPTANADLYWRDYLSQWSSKPVRDISAEMVMGLHQEIPTRARRRVKRIRDRTTNERRVIVYETKQKVSEGMANRVVGLLSALYGWALRTINPDTKRRYYDGPNPVRGLEKHAERSNVGRSLNESEVARFLAAVVRLPDSWRDFFLVLMWTGARVGNVCAMRWDDLDLESRVWLIPSSSTKTRRPYRVALPQQLVALLKNRKKMVTSDWVFPSKSKSGHVQEPKKVWYQLLEAARIRKLRMHDLRTTAASWGADVNIGPFVVSSQLGHSKPTMTAHYTHVSDAAKRAAVDAIVNSMLEKTSGSVLALIAGGHAQD